MLHEAQLGEMGSIIVSTLTLPRYKISDLIQTIAGSDGRVKGWRLGLRLDSRFAPRGCKIHFKLRAAALRSFLRRSQRFTILAQGSTSGCPEALVACYAAA